MVFVDSLTSFWAIFKDFIRQTTRYLSHKIPENEINCKIGGRDNVDINLRPQRNAFRMVQPIDGTSIICVIRLNCGF